MASQSKDISELAIAGHELAKIPVHINYDIIRLFSEGLYKSPQKAVEELVSNGYDAGAKHVHVLLPNQTEDDSQALEPLWVIDDGHGMDVHGFHNLWIVAESNKTTASPLNGRPPIGQFGIGKLAAYVLAWKLTHLSRVDGKLRLTSMNFHRATGLRQANGDTPVQVSLREVDETTAKSYLADIEQRNPAAWNLMFSNQNKSHNWTAAGLSDFKDLYNKLSIGRLRWVLATGLPLHADFGISLNAVPVISSKENISEIKAITLGSKDDTVATDLGLSKNGKGNLKLPGIGEVTGIARIYEKQLTTGKSADTGRSNGFFVRVRGRVINLEDELFGIDALNHAAWSRFALEIHANGLRDHLLSSREGVRDSESVRLLREYLRRVFNLCRSAYEAWERKQNQDLDIANLLQESPSSYVTTPLVHSVRSTVETGTESFYINPPLGDSNDDRSMWLTTHESEFYAKPFDQTLIERQGPNAPALHYNPSTRTIVVNIQHPFVDKLTSGGKLETPAKLFASSEVLIEGQLQDQGIDLGVINSFMRDRDRVLRIMAGDAPPTAAEVLRQLEAARFNSDALERAVGAVFRVLGFKYERKGGNAPGPDGVLSARLGRHRKGLADYSLVYDAKQTSKPSVPADKINLASLEDFRKQAGADFGFFIADEYQAEEDPTSAINRRIAAQEYSNLTLLNTKHLNSLIWLHYRYGVTLTELRLLFEESRTVFDATSWLASLKHRLSAQGEVPLRDLLTWLEQEKADTVTTPNVAVIRSKHASLHQFDPDHLIARLTAVENIVGVRWIEVEETSREVIMHQTSENILEEFNRNIDDISATLNIDEPLYTS